MALAMLLWASLVSATVESQHLALTLDPQAHEAHIVAQLTVQGPGSLILRLPEAATEIELRTQDRVEARFQRGENGRVTAEIPEGTHTLYARYDATWVEDIASGERAGEIHNFEVLTHIGEDGVFLSDAGAWYPGWIDAEGNELPMQLSLDLEPIEGWVFAATGNPITPGATVTPPPGPTPPAPGPKVSSPAGDANGPSDTRWRRPWSWRTPRPVEGMALIGGRRQLRGRQHPTRHGPVEILMQVSDTHADQAPVFLDAAAEYLTRYTELLGPYPFQRFTIVEGFFSAGFAFPGFTVLGPQVVARGQRSLAPGYLDHELLHSWWGNGVYVDVSEGNWAEALTTYCANYYRTVLEGGEQAGETYRRNQLMGLAANPERSDDAPLADFRPGGGASRFVGYTKGSFVFAMLESRMRDAAGNPDRGRMFRALGTFAERHLGERAGWSDLQRAFEAELGRPLDAFFRTWVREHTVPRTPLSADPADLDAFRKLFPDDQPVEISRGEDEGGPWVEIDPHFELYRVLPPEHQIPSLAATLGKGGRRVELEADREVAQQLGERIRSSDDGTHLLLVGNEPARRHRDLLERASDPIELADDGFRVGGIWYRAPTQAVLHTVAHPDQPGAFVSVFVANSDAGWPRARLLEFYSRETTLVWDGDEIVQRRTIQPNRRIHLEAATASMPSHP